ncbi:hypothetical protein M513_01393 [Trichuris suis]|uniref:Uncharacterized protein n=1 Tax=Trichuris suis TaxID=68888 RepID=A0A085MKH7_9BILA|nr:hypothetical protein M513_01393 [Trichuris suis]
MNTVLARENYTSTRIPDLLHFMSTRHTKQQLTLSSEHPAHQALVAVGVAVDSEIPDDCSLLVSSELEAVSSSVSDSSSLLSSEPEAVSSFDDDSEADGGKSSSILYSGFGAALFGKGKTDGHKPWSYMYLMLPSKRTR